MQEVKEKKPVPAAEPKASSSEAEVKPNKGKAVVSKTFTNKPVASIFAKPPPKKEAKEEKEEEEYRASPEKDQDEGEEELDDEEEEEEQEGKAAVKLYV